MGGLASVGAGVGQIVGRPALCVETAGGRSGPRTLLGARCLAGAPWAAQMVPGRRGVAGETGRVVWLAARPRDARPRRHGGSRREEAGGGEEMSRGPSGERIWRRRATDIDRAPACYENEVTGTQWSPPGLRRVGGRAGITAEGEAPAE